MAEPIGLTLASIGIFIQLYDVCDRCYRAYSLTRSFGDDFATKQLELEMQWTRLHFMVRRKRISEKLFDVNDQDHWAVVAIRNCLSRMGDCFQSAHDLMSRYAAQGNLVELKRNPAEESATSDPVHDQRLNQPQSSAQMDTEPGATAVATPSSKGKSRLSVLGLRKLKSRESQPSTSMHTEQMASSWSVKEKISLETQITGLETAREERTAQKLEAGSSLKPMQAFHWIREDRESLEGTIRLIRNCNNDLESVLNLLAMPDEPEAAAYALPEADGLEDLWSTVERVSKMANILHHDLMSVNYCEKSQRPFNLNVRLLEDHHMSWEQLDSHVPLHYESTVFYLQKHALQQIKHKPELLIVESYSTTVPAIAAADDAEGADSACLTTLHKPRPMHKKSSDEDSEVERLGHFQSPPSQKEGDITHIVYRECNAGWETLPSLQEVLAGPDYQKRVGPLSVVELARILACSHLYFECLRDKAANPRPKDIRYYNPGDMDGGEMHPPVEEIITQPWLEFGFGQRRKKQRLAIGTATARLQTSSILETGLVLFQIGLGRNIDYAKGLTKARATAVGNLHKLEARMGPLYTEMVQSLLEHPVRPSYAKQSANEKRRNDQLVRRIISALMQLARTLEATELDQCVLLDSDSGQEGELEEETFAGTTYDEKVASVLITNMPV